MCLKHLEQWMGYSKRVLITFITIVLIRFLPVWLVKNGTLVFFHLLSYDVWGWISFHMFKSPFSSLPVISLYVSFAICLLADDLFFSSHFISTLNIGDFSTLWYEWQISMASLSFVLSVFAFMDSRFWVIEKLSWFNETIFTFNYFILLECILADGMWFGMF